MRYFGNMQPSEPNMSKIVPLLAAGDKKVLITSYS